jgi:hypothetical protein
MRRGDWRAAHAISDAILAARDPLSRDDPALPYHLRWVWNGEALAGRRVLVRCYHGLGDTLQFARFLPRLSACAAALTIEAQAELVPLLRTMPRPARVIPFRRDAPAPRSECDVEIMELLHALRVTPEDLPGDVPYLFPRRLAIVQEPPSPERRGQKRPVVGICWQAGEWDGARSIPFRLLAPVLKGRELNLVSLQRNAPVPRMLHDPLCGSIDVLATASLISSLDLVITVDTMIAHLAGALGRPTWLLLKHDPDWRWMVGRADSPWYPSMRLFRQQRPGDWTGPLCQLAAALAGSRSMPAEH